MFQEQIDHFKESWPRFEMAVKNKLIKVVWTDLYKLYYLTYLFATPRLFGPQNDGVLLHVPNFKQFLRLHKYSPTFHFRSLRSDVFTLSTGHMFRLRVFTYGTGQYRGTHLAAFVQMKKSTNQQVEYPFRGVITFVVIDQSGNCKHVNHSIRASGENPCFQKPITEYNNENGVIKLVSLQRLIKCDQMYVKNNQLIMGVAIRYNENVI